MLEIRGSGFNIGCLMTYKFSIFFNLSVVKMASLVYEMKNCNGVVRSLKGHVIRPLVFTCLFISKLLLIRTQMNKTTYFIAICRNAIELIGIFLH